MKIHWSKCVGALYYLLLFFSLLVFSGYLFLCVQVDFFEPFWDSGEPRIGERGARGWKAWMLQQERGGWLIPPEPGLQTKHTHIDVEHCESTVV